MDDREKLAEVASAVAQHGGIRPASRALGIPYSTLHGMMSRFCGVNAHAASSEQKLGKLRASAREVRPLPRTGSIKTYIITAAQNNTGLAPCWENLVALADYVDAEIIVGAITYNIPSGAKGEKKTSRERCSDTQEEWWDDALQPYMVNCSVELAPGLVWCGELNILPTAERPISGLEAYTGRDSSIFPHTKFAVQSVAAPKSTGAKFVYTTGACTLRNYIGKKAGQKAEFHHGYGGLIVEVCSDGVWFVRQLNADSDGAIYDLDRLAVDGKVTTGHRPEAIVWGDVHVRQLQDETRDIQWGAGGILDAMRPRLQVLHDVLDFRSQNHHDRRDPWKGFEKHCVKGTGVADEVREASEFVASANRAWAETVIVRSNHDEAIVRWLKEADFREDHQNAVFLLEATLAKYKAISRGDGEFDLIEWAFKSSGIALGNVRFLRRDEEYIVCPEFGGGIDISMHGDQGPNGSRGSIIVFARTGRKCVVAHSHAAGMHEGAMQVGVSAALDQGYNEGLSSWSHTHAMIYHNAKRTLFTVKGGRWRGC